MKKHLLEAQLEVNDDPLSSSEGKGVDVDSCSPYATCHNLEACQCKHLQKWLPHVLNLRCVPDGGAWMMANPVHALHLASHLESDGATVFLPGEQPTNVEPALYGEEQCRTNGVVSNGISHVSCELAATETHEESKYVTRTLLPQPHSNASLQRPSAQRNAKVSQPQVLTKSAGNPTLAASALHARQTQPLQLLPKPPNWSVQPQAQLSNNPLPAPTLKQAPVANAAISMSATAVVLAEPDRTPTHASSASTNLSLDEERFQELCRREQLILQQRYSALSKRKSSTDSKRKASSKKKKSVVTGDATSIVPLLPDSLLLSSMGFKTVVKVNHDAWDKDARLARSIVEEWMERFRLSRNAYWDEKGAKNRAVSGELRQCQQCSVGFGDELMQCLECSFIGCAPQSLWKDSKQHMMHHMLRTGHSFAVTCGERSEVFCFKCGEFVYHEIFDHEKERINISRQLPWMGWHDYPVQRSFDSMQFVNTPEHGVVWRGLLATYPSLVPKEHVRAARLSMRRLSVFCGDLGFSSLSWGSKALEFAVYQNQKDAKHAWRIKAPVGMYNLGNTCFMSTILQCLIHCVPLQRHFLRDIGHHYKSCELVRNAYAEPVASMSQSTSTPVKPEEAYTNTSICLACEVDRLFLQYFGSSIGRDVSRAVCTPLNPSARYRLSVSPSLTSAEGVSNKREADLQGEPLVTTSILAAAWKTSGMDHLAGYEQRDAPEFLHAFLDAVGKHCGEYRKLIQSMRIKSLPSKAKDETNNVTFDIIKELFEGTLRSVLICEVCGCKRKIPETFLNVSLPLSKHVDDSATGTHGTRGSKSTISLQRCLDHFTAPEALSDPVDCPSCRRKTPTKKQHTFAKLPKVLCLHLKRFDAAKNKKIDDFVSFPATGLDMGRLLPHWREAGAGKTYQSGESDTSENGSSPQVLYDLFASANHTGTMHQGHYVANVKVDGQWYHCNDAHVSKCEDEDEVLKSEGAYVLFYIRR